MCGVKVNPAILGASHAAPLNKKHTVISRWADIVSTKRSAGWRRVHGEISLFLELTQTTPYHAHTDYKEMSRLHPDKKTDGITLDMTGAFFN